jgi:hypothetical protein
VVKKYCFALRAFKDFASSRLRGKKGFYMIGGIYAASVMALFSAA